MLATPSQRSSSIRRLPRRVPMCLTGPMTALQMVKICRPCPDSMLIPHPSMMTSIMIKYARIRHFKSLKGQRKIVCMTAYSAPMMRALDAHCNLLLVGDPVAMVVCDMDTTQGADLDLMIGQEQAVMRRRQKAVVNETLP